MDALVQHDEKSVKNLNFFVYLYTKDYLLYYAYQMKETERSLRDYVEVYKKA